MNARGLVLPVLFSALMLGGCYVVPTPPPPTETAPVPSVRVMIYFADPQRYAANIEPFETGVTRFFPSNANLPELALQAFFQGPTDEERAGGLEAITSDCTGFSALTIQNGIARVYLTGPCNSHGATYTIGQQLMPTLLQFPQIEYVKLYDEAGQTGDPDGFSNSIPFVLEP
jgi:hypothetical protein